MGDEIKQSGNIERVMPLNPSRDAGRRKRPPAAPRRDSDTAKRKPDDRPPHQVDEYV